MSGSGVYSPTMDVVTLLTNARAEIADRGVAQTELFNDKNGKVCAIGSVMLALNNGDERHAFNFTTIVTRKTVGVYNDALHFLGGWGSITLYNDTRRIFKKRAMLKRFDQAIAAAKAHAATTDAPAHTPHTVQISFLSLPTPGVPASIAEYTATIEAQESELLPA